MQWTIVRFHQSPKWVKADRAQYLWPSSGPITIVVMTLLSLSAAAIVYILAIETAISLYYLPMTHFLLRVSWYWSDSKEMRLLFISVSFPFGLLILHIAKYMIYLSTIVMTHFTYSNTKRLSRCTSPANRLISMICHVHQVICLLRRQLDAVHLSDFIFWPKEMFFFWGGWLV